MLGPWGKKALKLSLNSTSSDNRQTVNMDTFYGALSVSVKNVSQHHIFMNTSEKPCWNNLPHMIIIVINILPLTVVANNTSDINSIELLQI